MIALRYSVTPPATTHPMAHSTAHSAAHSGGPPVDVMGSLNAFMPFSNFLSGLGVSVDEKNAMYRDLQRVREKYQMSQHDYNTLLTILFDNLLDPMMASINPQAMAQLRESMMATMQNCTDEIARKNAEVAAARSATMTDRAELDSLRQRVAASSSENATLRQQLENGMVSNATIATERNAATQRGAELQADIVSLRSRVAELLVASATREAEHREAAKRAAESATECASLRETTVVAQTQLAVANTARGTAEAAVDALRAQLRAAETASAEHREVAKRAAESATECAALRATAVAAEAKAAFANSARVFAEAQLADANSKLAIHVGQPHGAMNSRKRRHGGAYESDAVDDDPPPATATDTAIVPAGPADAVAAPVAAQAALDAVLRVDDDEFESIQRGL